MSKFEIDSYLFILHIIKYFLVLHILFFDDLFLYSIPNNYIVWQLFSIFEDHLNYYILDLNRSKLIYYNYYLWNLLKISLFSKYHYCLFELINKSKLIQPIF
jgi:hypothetical protein